MFGELYDTNIYSFWDNVELFFSQKLWAFINNTLYINKIAIAHRAFLKFYFVYLNNNQHLYKAILGI